MFKKLVFFVLIALLLSNMVMAENVYFGYLPLEDNLWSNSNNWTSDASNPHDPPAGSDLAYIWNGQSAVVDYSAPEFSVLKTYPSSTVNVVSGGSLAFNTALIGNQAGLVAEVIVSGGSFTSTRTDDSSPGIRLGEVADSNGMLTITSGTVTSRGMQVGTHATSTGKVNLYGGQLVLNYDSNGSLYLNDHGKIEMKTGAQLIMAGDRTFLLTNTTSGYIPLGYLYTDEPGNRLEATYDSGTDMTTVEVVVETNIYFGYNTLEDNLWSNPNNWAGEDLTSPHAPPVGSNYGIVWPGSSALVNYAAPEFALLKAKNDTNIEVVSGGSLESNTLLIGDGAGDVSEVIVSGGVLTSTRTDDGSPGIRLGAVADSNGILTITSGTVSSRGMQVGAHVDSTGQVNLYGGELQLNYASNAALYLYYPRGKMEIRDAGIFRHVGFDSTTLLNGYITDGLIYCSNAPEGMNVRAVYEGGDTIIRGDDFFARVPGYRVWGWNEEVDGNWSTPANWHTDVPPQYGDSADILSGLTSTSCVLSEPTPVVGQVRLYSDAVLDIQTGGSLDSSSILIIGYKSDAEMKISGGSYYSSDETTSSPRVRLGYQDGDNGILTITDGSFNASSMMLPYSLTGATGRVNLYGGTLELRSPSTAALQLNYGGRTGGSIDIKAPGKLILSGGNDLRTSLIAPKIASGEIFSSDPNTLIVYSFDGNSTIVQGITSDVDLNRDNSVDFEDFALFADQWQQIGGSDFNEPNPNRLIFAPENSTIVIDGSFGTSEWDNASEWAVFGKWYPRGEGLSSTTKARYAWNSTADMLYIAIESTEPNEFAQFQVGGLMGDITTDPGARPSGCWQATEINLQYNGSSIDVTSRDEYGYGGITTGIVAAHSFDGTTLRLEIATPIYSDWIDDGTGMTLSAGMDIYTYINILSDNDGTLKGDSQCTRAGEVGFYEGQAMARSSAVRLLNSLPATCADVPSHLSNYADFAGDCYVDLEDLAVFIEDWLD